MTFLPGCKIVRHTILKRFEDSINGEKFCKCYFFQKMLNNSETTQRVPTFYKQTHVYFEREIQECKNIH